MEVEKLDLGNVIELNRIREILLHYQPELLSFFEQIVSVANKRLNDEPLHKKYTITSESEEEIEVELESDEDDSDTTEQLSAKCAPSES